MKIKRVWSVAAALVLTAALVVGLAGCGSTDSGSTDSGEEAAATETGALDELTVQSLWLPQGQFAGLYVAQAKGFYEEEGIDITILPGGSDVSSEDQVENDVAQIGTAFYSSVLTYQEAGYDFINIFQTFNKSPQYLVSKASSGIETPADLKGKKVANWFGGREYEFYALAELNGLDPQKDIEWVQQDYTMDQLNNDEVDVASAMAYNEYLLLFETEGYEEGDINVLDMNEEGAAMLEDCLFVKRDWAEENADLLERFIRATKKGWAYAYEHPEEAGQIVFEAGDESSTLEHQVAMTKVASELAVPEGNTGDIGKLDTKKIQQTIDLAYDTGLIQTKIDINDSIDASYWEAASK